jgi:hypothetical protein
MPALQNRFAAFYAERFDPAEIDALIDFYGSLTGSKLIEGMYAGADINALLQSIGEDGTDPVTAEEVGKFSRSTVERIMPAFTAADRQALLDFAETPVFKKLSRNLADFQRLMADVANEPSPALDAEIERVVKRTIEDYFARAKAADVS